MVVFFWFRPRSSGIARLDPSNSEKPGNPGFLDQEILVSVFLCDQDLRNSNSGIPVKFVCSVPNSHEVMSKSRFWSILVTGKTRKSWFRDQEILVSVFFVTRISEIQVLMSLWNLYTQFQIVMKLCPKNDFREFQFSARNLGPVFGPPISRSLTLRSCNFWLTRWNSKWSKEVVGYRSSTFQWAIQIQNPM